MRLRLIYDTPHELAAHLSEQDDVLLLRTDLGKELPPQTLLELHFFCADKEITINASLLQILDSLGLVVTLEHPQPLYAALEKHLAHYPQPKITAPPKIELYEEEKKANGIQFQQGVTALSWGIEKLQAHWQELSTPEKIRVAQHGKRPARALVMRTNDKTLHTFLLKNPKISADEVAILAGMPNLDPNLLRHIANSAEWTRHRNIARALVTNPKLPLPLVKKLLPSIPRDELRRLTKSGKVKAAVKQMMMKIIERGR